jgi:hypothetical protein
MQTPLQYVLSIAVFVYLLCALFAKKFQSSDIIKPILSLLPYFPAHKTHPDFFVTNFRKNNDECILILVIYWKKTGLLHMKIRNHNIIYSS